MSLISLHGVNMAFNGPKLLDDASFDVEKGQRICVLGRNGAGKSTLLRLLSREFNPDSGEIIFAPNLKVACLEQNVPDDIPGTAFEIVAAGLGKPGECLADFYREKQTASRARLAELEHSMAEQECWKLEPVIEKVLHQTGILPEAVFSSLSGGMKRRVFLARALAAEPDLLLLDEPTNHLDLDSIEWLEGFLVSSRITTAFVSHDRRFLRNVATRIIEIDRGKLYDFTCGYEEFLERKKALLENEEKAWALFDKKLAQEEVWIRQGVKARRTRSEGRVKALLRMREERKNKREGTGLMKLEIREGLRSGDKVIETAKVSFGYGDTDVVKDLSFLLARGDRVGVIGPNGCGKTTLINILLGKLEPRQGSVVVGANVKAVHFDQLRLGVDPEKTAWENLCPEGGETVFVNEKPRHVMSYLQDFLFTSERARTPVKKLSGGERHRLLLARLFTAPSNLIVLDEPTNDLDAETLELLEEVLSEYEGTVLIVSHDREFLNNTVTSALVFRGNGVIGEYAGGYDDWAKYLPAAEEERPKKEKKSEIRPAQPKEPAKRKLSQKERRELEGLPAVIEALEKEQEDLNLKLADYTLCQKPGFVPDTRSRLVFIEQELAGKMRRWEELEEISSTGGK